MLERRHNRVDHGRAADGVARVAAAARLQRGGLELGERVAERAVGPVGDLAVVERRARKVGEQHDIREERRAPEGLTPYGRARRPAR